MKTKTLFWEKGALRLLDQTLLPGEIKYISCRDVQSAWEAIKTLRVRGAPAIGDAAAYAVAVGAFNSKAKNPAGLIKDIGKTANFLKTARPTAVNLFWAVDRMYAKALEVKNKPVSEIKKILLEEAHRISRQDRSTCKKLSFNGAGLIKDGDGVMTYCNAGSLATAGLGTAIGVLYAAESLGKKIKVYSCETRPLLQGARLSCWELMENKMDATLICDNTAGWVMKQGLVDAVFIGADRIASNGDAANKIGSYSLAVLAAHHKIAFYVCAPLSTFDFSIKSGRDIPIEERSGDEVACFAGVRTAPPKIKTYSPAFDVVPAGLISAIVTEKGVIAQPSAEKIKKIR